MSSTPVPTSQPDAALRRCRDSAALFQHPLLEDPPSASATADQRRQHMVLAQKAATICHACPVMPQCLYDAVVKYDVAGFAAGTTQRQRLEIRDRLRIAVIPEDFDTMAGITARHRKVDHAEVVRLRQTNPHESLETLAHRLGCSLSTVKRHLRRHRSDSMHPVSAQRRIPTLAEVIVTFRQVVVPLPMRRAA